MNRKIISLILIVSLITTFTMPVIAVEPVVDTSSPLYQKYTVTEAEKEKFNQYVSLNEETLQYFITKDARSKLTSAEYQKLSHMIEQTNSFIKMIDFEQYGDEVFIISPDKEEFGSSLSKNVNYVEGVTKIEIHWWGYTIYLSKTAIGLAIDVGITIAGFKIAHTIVRAALNIIGYNAYELIPGGIVFDYNAIVTAPPGIGIVLNNVIFVTSVRFQ